MTTYRIIRMYKNSEKESEIIKTRISLEEAQAHCKNPETTSSKCSSLEGLERKRIFGDWFDGYEEES